MLLGKSKQSLRKQILSKLTSLSPTDKITLEKRIIKQLLTSSLWKEANVIGITSSTSIEWNTEAIFKQAWLEGKEVCVPKAFPKLSLMKFYTITSFKELTVGFANILEPDVSEEKYVPKEKIDLLIVPGIVFDHKGFRIGFGGGYYDRFLVDFPNKTVSLLSTVQLVETLPIETHDIPVEYLITEKGLHRVKGTK